MPDFPAEAVPDGAILAPHHLPIGVGITLFLMALAWNDSTGEPAVMLAGLGAALFAFWFVWPYYPATGAALVLAGLLLASTAFVARSFWRGYPLAFQVAVAVGLLVALDDALSHAFGIWTPLDWLFKVWMLGWLR